MLYNNAVYILGLYLLFSHAFLFVEALPSLLQARVQSAPVMSLNNDEPGGPLQRPSQAGEPEIPYLVNTTSRSNDSNPACWPVSLGDKQKPIDKTFESCLPGYNNAGYDPACWAKLQMSEWIPVWVSLQRPCASNHTCGPQNINAWTNRFLHETGGRNDNRDCSTLVNPDYGGCGHPAYESPEDCSKSDALLDARHSYLDWAIYRVGVYFYEWQDVAKEGVFNAASKVDDIVKIIDPVQKRRHWLRTILVGLSSAIFGAAFPGAGASADVLLKAVVATGKGLVTGAPGALSSLLPSKDAALNQVIETSQLENELNGAYLGSVYYQIQDTLGPMLGYIQGVEQYNNDKNDYEAFVNFTADGRFAGPNAPFLGVDQAISIQRGMQTYIASDLLKTKGYKILMLPMIQPDNLYKDPDNFCPEWTGYNCKGDKDIGCRDTLDPETDMCDYVWYSRKLKSSFTLIKDGGTDKGKVVPIISQLFKAFYTDGGHLFESAAFCQLPTLFPEASKPLPATYGLGAEWGFFFFADTFPAIEPYAEPVTEPEIVAQLGGRSSFVSINGRYPKHFNAFAEFSKMAEFKDRFVHPNDTLFKVSMDDGAATVDCLNQLDLKIGNSWGGKAPDKWQRCHRADDGKDKC